MTKNERERAQKHLYKQAGSQNWFVRFHLHGRQVRETTGTADETEACRVVLARLDEAGADRSGAKKFVGPEQKKVTVQQLLDALKLNFEIRGKSGSRLLSNLKPLEEWFGYFKAVELQGTDLDRFIKHAQEHGRCKDSTKPAKPASINRSLQLLGQAYKLANRDGILKHEPPKRRLSEIGNARSGFFSSMEFRSLLSNLPERWRDYVEFFYLCGMRPKQIQSLSWHDVDADCIRSRAENVKNRHAHSIPLTGQLADVIARRRLQMSPQTSLIFHYKGNPIGDHRKSWQTACILLGLGKFVCPECWRKKCERVLDADGKCSECSKTWKREKRKYIGKILYDLRRTFCRDGIRAGVAQSVVMSISGHRTVSTFLRYNITSDADQRQALAARQEYTTKQEQAAQPVTPDAEGKPVTQRVQ